MKNRSKTLLISFSALVLLALFSPLLRIVWQRVSPSAQAIKLPVASIATAEESLPDKPAERPAAAAATLPTEPKREGPATEVRPAQPQKTEATLKTGPIAEGLLTLRNPVTNLIPSHYGHPGYDELGFLYDIAVSALVLDAAGHRAEAEAILDYFAQRLSIPMEEVLSLADTNGVYGIVKILNYQGPNIKKTRALVNAIDVTSTDVRGKGLLEFYTTPGPMAFMIFSMLQIDPEKYREPASILGEALLTMQDADGGVRDGDRAPDRVHTEPNMDAASAFLMLHKVTGDAKWLAAAQKALEWFRKYVYDKDAGTIYQGIWRNRPSKIFATDVYSWTMAGPAGDDFTSDELKRLTEKMLSTSLVKITLELPDGARPTVILVDFSNADNSRVVNARLGPHPMGTIEWTGGVVLALQKNAVRLWERGDKAAAQRYKALADLLLAQTTRCFYSLGEKLPGLFTFYATAQGVEIAPFGAIENKSTNGWRTTFFYVDRGPDELPIKGGASIGAWVLLPYLGVNPFILHDGYKTVYDSIPVDDKTAAEAANALEDYVGDRVYTETIPTAGPDKRVQIVEPHMFNRRMWEAIEHGFRAKNETKDAPAARSAFTEAAAWATKVLQNPVWLGLARSDNALKKKEYGGIIFYPWGTEYPHNDHPLHFEIQRYPILNEVGTAAWGMATASFELGDREEAKKWIGNIIDNYSLHQIAAVRSDKPDLITGYWNALISWEDKTLGVNGNPEMYKLYLTVLSEKGLATAKPPVVVSSSAEKEFRSDMSGPRENNVEEPKDQETP